MALDQKQTSLLFAGAIALVLLCVGIVGIDYTETRNKASIVPLNTQRIGAVEKTMEAATREQAAATRELSRAVSDLRVAIGELKSAK